MVALSIVGALNLAIHLAAVFSEIVLIAKTLSGGRVAFAPFITVIRARLQATVQAQKSGVANAAMISTYSSI